MKSDLTITVSTEWHGKTTDSQCSFGYQFKTKFYFPAQHNDKQLQPHQIGTSSIVLIIEAHSSYLKKTVEKKNNFGAMWGLNFGVYKVVNLSWEWQ